MRYPLGLVLDSAKHILAGKLRHGGKFAVMLSLDPLGGCVRSCGVVNQNGNGTEASSEKAMLSVEQCLAAMEECGAPIVSICGGEPLEYSDIQLLTREILARGKHLFLCTDGTLIRSRLHMIQPFTNFFWNVKLDGTQEVHDMRCGRPGVFVETLDGVKAAKNAGFFVVVTTTVYPDTDVHDVERLFQRLHAMHVDGYMFAPEYSGKKLCRDSSATYHSCMHQRFRELSDALGDYELLLSPIYMEYLRGERELDCCAWGSPVYGPQGWHAPCYLLNQGYTQNYRSLLDDTLWENYGRGVNPKCEPCMCHTGYESAALLGANPKAGDFWKMLAWQFSGSPGEKRARARKP